MGSPALTLIEIGVFFLTRGGAYKWRHYWYWLRNINMTTTETLAGGQRLDYIANNDKLHVTVDKDLVGVLAGTGSYK